MVKRNVFLEKFHPPDLIKNSSNAMRYVLKYVMYVLREKMGFTQGFTRVGEQRVEGKKITGSTAKPRRCIVAYRWLSYIRFDAQK